jgi:hypothetical protein
VGEKAGGLDEVSVVVKAGESANLCFVEVLV